MACNITNTSFYSGVAASLAFIGKVWKQCNLIDRLTTDLSEETAASIFGVKISAAWQKRSLELWREERH
jgi:hypothetical protein